MNLTTILKFELVNMNTILLNKEKNVQTQEQIYLVDLKIGFMKSVKQKAKKPYLQKSL